MLNNRDIALATQLIKSHQRILVIPHANVDPDCMSSALACYQMLRALGKDVTVICPETTPESLAFLPGVERFSREIEHNDNFVITVNLEDGIEVDKLRYTVEDKRVNIIVVPKKGKITTSQISFGEGEKKYDLIIVVDSADLALLGSVYTDHVDLFSEIPVLNIDHHVSNTRYGQTQLIDVTAASATEVLYTWFSQVPEMSPHISADMATLLLTGLITDTRSFQNPNTTPRSLEVAAELLEKGARQQEIIQHIYKTKPLSTLKIWGRALNKIQVDPVARIVWSEISVQDLQEMGATSKETHGILDELISTIPDADVHVLFTELEEGGLKASVRSNNAIDVNRLAGETYSGGGHARAAGFKVRSFSNFSLQVLECVQKMKEAMKRQGEEGNAPLPRPVSQPSIAQAAPRVAPTESRVERQKQGTAFANAVPGSRDIVQQMGSQGEQPGSTDVVKTVTEQ